MSRFYILLPILVLLIPLGAGGEPGQEPDAGPAEDPSARWIGILRGCNKGVFSIQADFVQERFNKLTPFRESMEGVVVARRGGLLRLDYAKPKRSSIISDGITLWAYDKQEKTAFMDDAKSSFLSRIFGFVLGEGTDAFSVKHMGGAKEPGQGTAAIELAPRVADSVVESIVLTLADDCPCVRKVLVVDRAGAVTRVTLSNIRSNVKVGKSRFAFTPPPGVKIIQL